MHIIKNLKLIFISFVAVIICLATLCACSSNLDSNNNKTIVDSYGRTINVPIDVKTIATVGSATRYCVYAGAAEKLIAVTDMDDENETRPYTVAANEKLKNLPHTNNGNHINSTTVNKEMLTEIHPDVILSSRSADECQKLQNDILIPVVGIYSQDKIFDKEVYDAIEITAKAAGTESIANKKIEWLKSFEQDIKSRIKDNDAPVYRGAVNFKGSKNLCGTISNYCIYDDLNINNVAYNNNIQGAYDTSLEQILMWDPEYIFIDCENEKRVNEQVQSNKETFEKMKAFKNNKVYEVGPFNNNGTNIEYGLCEMIFTAKTLYPNEFSDINLESIFREIFTTIDGRDILDNISAKGIKFEQAQF